MNRLGLRLVCLCLGLAAGCQAASQAFAWRYGYDEVLGEAWRLGADFALYPPWAIFVWRNLYYAEASEALAESAPLILLGAMGGLGLGVLADGPRPVRRRRGWGRLAEARRAGLLGRAGCVLGVLDGRLLATTDLRPTLVTGGTRSGKGRGHVVPSLLS